MILNSEEKIKFFLETLHVLNIISKIEYLYFIYCASGHISEKGNQLKIHESWKSQLIYIIILNYDVKLNTSRIVWKLRVNIHRSVPTLPYSELSTPLAASIPSQPSRG